MTLLKDIVTGSRYEVSLQTYETLIRQFDLGEIHPSLSRGPVWYSQDDLKALDRAAQDELNERGLSRTGQIDSTFLEMLRVLQTASVEYYTVTLIDDKSFIFRVACSNQQAVLAISTVDKLSLFPTRPESAIRDLVARLPPASPAKLHSLSCADSDYRLIAAGKTPERSSASITDAKQILRWINEPRQRSGRMHAATRDQWGVRKKSQEVAQWSDTSAGRILAHLDSNEWISLTGASPQDMVDKFNQLRANIR